MPVMSIPRLGKLGELIKLDEHRPHLSGKAKCARCHHEWVGVAPVGTFELECPKCEGWHGHWIHPAVPKVVFECACGCRTFSVTKQGVCCYSCGVTTGYGEL